MGNNYLKGVHHIAIICSNYEKSKDFYTNTLGLTIVREVYREQRQSYKLDLALNDEYIIELASQSFVDEAMEMMVVFAENIINISTDCFVPVFSAILCRKEFCIAAFVYV